MSLTNVTNHKLSNLKNVIFKENKEVFMRILLIILAFNFIIFIHELGHFLVAKLSGIKVEEFSMFVGPKLFSIKRGETQYSLRLFPILAYVKMEGEEEASDSDRAFSKKSVPIRAAVIAAGPLSNLIAAFVLITIYFFSVGFLNTTIDEVRDDSAAYKAGIRKGDQIVSYGNIPVYQRLDIFQFLYISKGEPTEITVKRQGIKEVLHITPEIKQYFLGFSPKDDPVKTNIVGSVSPDSPAEKAGMQAGDEIVKLNDVEVNAFKEISSFIQENKENPIEITVIRDGAAKVINALPMKATEPSYDIGVAFEYERGDIFETIKQAALFTYSNARMVPYTLAWLFQGKLNIFQMSGPVGIVTSMNDVVQQSPNIMDAILNLLSITAFISIAVGATNLIPFPALDGSKLVLILVEAVRRKPIPIEKEAVIMTIGFFLLIGLAIFITSNDIFKLVERIAG